MVFSQYQAKIKSSGRTSSPRDLVALRRYADSDNVGGQPLSDGKSQRANLPQALRKSCLKT
jgi:hypothetical protein